jgi:SAM-dependent methyltransferase
MNEPAGASSEYWRTNSLDDEGGRLRLLEEIADHRTVRMLTEAGVTQGWHCAELGAGAGSIARWLANRVGPSGSLLVLDLDANLLSDLKSMPRVEVREADLTTTSLPVDAFDLVHVRNVLMHLSEPEQILEKMIGALRPGGVLVVEEGDGFPITAATSTVFRHTLEPLTSRWVWARLLPGRLTELGLKDLEVLVEAEMLRGQTPLARFWHHTLRTARGIVTSSRSGSAEVTDHDVDATLALLEDASF